jgi:nitrate/nitrite transporter NarK
MFGVAGLLLFASAPNPVIALGVVMAAGVSMGFASSNNWAITQTLAGREAAGRWTGIQNGFGNLGGVVSPWLTGFVVDRTGSFFLAFAVTSGVVVVGTALYFALIPRVAPIKWVSAPPAEATGRAAD